MKILLTLQIPWKDLGETPRGPWTVQWKPLQKNKSKEYRKEYKD